MKLTNVKVFKCYSTIITMNKICLDHRHTRFHRICLWSFSLGFDEFLAHFLLSFHQKALV